MNADPAIQLQLLELQSVDTTLAQLSHRRRTLPALTVIAERDERLRTLADDELRATTQIEDLRRAERRLEADVEQVRARSDRDQQRLTSGVITSPKELEKLQHEVTTLARRQGELEDQVLELMERHEAADAVLAAVRSDLDSVTSERDAAVRERDETIGELDVDGADQQRRRHDLAAGVPADLLALYERIRASSGGRGAAALRQRRCEGCRLELSGTDLGKARTAAPEAVLRCEECGRILIRTPESGLS